MTVGSIISFLTDYGQEDEFVGIVHRVIAGIGLELRVIDISHQIPRHDVRAGALMLWRSAPWLAPGVILGVVDPGVGTNRRAVAFEVAEAGTAFVGPDNGLLLPAATRLGSISVAVELGGGERTAEGPAVGAPAAAAGAGRVPPAAAAPARVPRPPPLRRRPGFRDRPLPPRVPRPPPLPVPRVPRPPLLPRVPRPPAPSPASILRSAPPSPAATSSPPPPPAWLRERRSTPWARSLTRRPWSGTRCRHLGRRSGTGHPVCWPRSCGSTTSATCSSTPAQLIVIGLGSTPAVQVADRTWTCRIVDAYGDLPPGELGLVVDSYGLLSISLNGASAAELVGVAAGAAIWLSRPGPGSG